MMMTAVMMMRAMVAVGDFGRHRGNSRGDRFARVRQLPSGMPHRIRQRPRRDARGSKADSSEVTAGRQQRENRRRGGKVGRQRIPVGQLIDIGDVVKLPPAGATGAQRIDVGQRINVGYVIPRTRHSFSVT
jgi:hypothetical protein